MTFGVPPSPHRLWGNRGGEGNGGAFCFLKGGGGGLRGGRGLREGGGRGVAKKGAWLEGAVQQGVGPEGAGLKGVGPEGGGLK